MNMENVTLEECVRLHERIGLDIVINEGRIIGFEKVENCGHRIIYFSFSRCKSRGGSSLQSEASGRNEKDQMHLLHRTWNNSDRAKNKRGYRSRKSRRSV